MGLPAHPSETLWLCLNKLGETPALLQHLLQRRLSGAFINKGVKCRLCRQRRHLLWVQPWEQEQAWTRHRATIFFCLAIATPTFCRGMLWSSRCDDKDQCDNKVSAYSGRSLGLKFKACVSLKGLTLHLSWSLKDGRWSTTNGITLLSLLLPLIFGLSAESCWIFSTPEQLKPDAKEIKVPPGGRRGAVNNLRHLHL